MKNFLKDSECEIRLSDEKVAGDNSIEIKREWVDNNCSIYIRNYSEREDYRIREIVIFKGEIPFNSSTEIYAEGYNMLSQFKGSIREPKDITNITDRNHYKLPQAKGFTTVYNLMAFLPKKEEKVVIAFSSCNHYCGEIRFNEKYYEIVMDFEDLQINSGKTIQLESFFYGSGNDLNILMDNLSKEINKHHPLLSHNEIPTGWCSWYCYGPNITDNIIHENIASVKEKLPELKYIQIDDGYQKFMGDWLEPNATFLNGIKELCLKIKEQGFEPAIWVAPFIAEKDSNLFKEHQDWFKKDQEGNPLESSRHSFGGWRNGPWYMLDGTNPAALSYLKKVFKVMRQEWECKYFKLDAIMWGALPGGKYYDENATRIDAYRGGMKAILEATGEDSFILGCNAPMWPSLGVVHGMRISNDISRNWKQISQLTDELVWRNWQHQRLWINDPDCIVLEENRIDVVLPDGTMFEKIETVTKDEYDFHSTAIFASGGMVLSGDSIVDMKKETYERIKKLIPPTNVSAIFDDTSFTIGRTYVNNKLMISVLNCKDRSEDISINLNALYYVKNFWTGECLGELYKIELKGFRPHFGQVYECTKM